MSRHFLSKMTPSRTLLAVLVCGSLMAACASPLPPPSADGEAEMVNLGQPFETSKGQIFVLRVQDEFRLIRCIPDGPIAGCYEDVLSVSGDSVDWNSWMDVDDVPGLRVAFVSPTAVAVSREDPPAIPPQAK